MILLLFLLLSFAHADSINTPSYFSIGNVTVPTITDTFIIPPIAMNGTPVNITLNGTADLTIIVTLPNGTEIPIPTITGLTQFFNQTELLGEYNVTFVANNSLGQNVVVTDSFIVAEFINWSIHVRDSFENGLNATVTIYFRNYTVTFDTQNGSFTLGVPNQTIDVHIHLLNNKIDLDLFGVTPPPNNNLTINLEEQNNTLGFLRIYTIKPQHNFVGAVVNFTYADLVFSNENILEVFKCANYNSTSSLCNGNFEEIATTRHVLTDRFTFPQFNFSGYGIKEDTPSTPVSGGGGGGGGGGGSRPDPFVSIEILDTPLTHYLPQGTYATIPVRIVNHGTQGATLYVAQTGLSHLISHLPGTIFIDGGEIRTYYFDIYGSDMGVFQGKIDFTTQEKEYIVPATIHVLEQKPSITIDITDVPRFSELGDTITLTYKTMSDVEPIYIEIILLRDGQQYVVYAGTVAGGTHFATFQLPADLVAGEYILVASAKSNSGTAQDSKALGVSGKRVEFIEVFPERVTKTFPWIMFVLLAIILLVLFKRRQIDAWFATIVQRKILILVKKRKPQKFPLYCKYPQKSRQKSKQTKPQQKKIIRKKKR